MFFDPMYFIVVGPAMLLAMWARYRVKSAYGKYKDIQNSSGLCGKEAAQKMLKHAGVTDVGIEVSEGTLSDHYDPQEKMLRLSSDVYHNRSVAAVGIACHEAGHAIQDQNNYTPLVLSNAIVPMAHIGSWLSFPLILLGIFLKLTGLTMVGIFIFAAVVLFQIINLPVEFNASTRAKNNLKSLAILRTKEEQEGVNQVLNAAAMTYVAATITALAQLLYFILLAER